MLLRLEELEKRLHEWELNGPDNVGDDIRSLSKDGDQSLLTSAPTEERANRYKNHSLARSKLKRDGLKAGTPAPDFRLPRVDGRGELTLSEFRGRPVLLVFSSPHCGPCNTLAPELEKFHREHPELQMLMISRGEPKENRAKIKEHRLTFLVLLQQQWEISRQYAMFATPVAYLIDEAGSIAADVAVGVDSILSLISKENPRNAEALAG
jgi:peroxiredoxin